MPATATSPIAMAAEKLRQMVAASSTFQTAVSAADRDEALQRVFLKNVLGSPNRPLAIVSMGDQFSYQLIAGGEQNYFRPTGSLFLYLARDTNPDYYEDRVSAEFDAWNFFGSVLTDVIDLAAADDADSPFDPEESHLSIVDMDVQAWGETDKKNWESLGRFFWAAARVVWGDGT